VKVLEEKGESVAPGTLLGTSHTYVIKTGTQEKTGAKRVDLLRGQKTDRVDVSLQPEELDAMENVLPAKYEEAREEEKLRNKPVDLSDMVVEHVQQNSRKRKMHDKEGKKKKDFKF
jgi:splicing factor 3B subunit 2